MRRHRNSPPKQVFRKSSLIKPLFSSYYKIIAGIGGGSTAAYFLWLFAFKTQELGEINTLVARNDNNCLPLWSSESAVVNLREKDKKLFLLRRQHTYKKDDLGSTAPRT